MSISVGASSHAKSYLQPLLQQDTAGESSADNTSDPLSVLLQSLSGDGLAAGQTASIAASPGAAVSSHGPSFGSDTLSALISLQGQQTDDTATGGSTSNRSASNLLEQSIKLQSRALTAASSTLSAIA